MSTIEMLESVQFVVTPDGRPAAVQMSMEVWNGFLDWLEDIEDRATVRALLPRLREGPRRSGALHWDDIEGEWDASAQ